MITIINITTMLSAVRFPAVSTRSAQMQALF